MRFGTRWARCRRVDLAEVEEVVLGCGQPHGAGRPQHRACRRAAGGPAGHDRGGDGEPLLQLGSAGGRPGGAPRDQRARRRGDRRRRRVDHDDGPRQLAQPVGAGARRPASTWRWATRRKSSRSAITSRAQAQDEYALVSQQRTARAQQDGFFRDEIAPMKVTRAILDKKSGEKIGEEEVCVDRDECNRPDTTLEGLLKLPPAFDTKSGTGSVTAGNSSQLSDGASATRRHVGRAREERSASSRCSSSAATRSPAASPTRWESARCSPSRSCSSARASGWTTSTSGS